jgi:surface antigen
MRKVRVGFLAWRRRAGVVAALAGLGCGGLAIAAGPVAASVSGVGACVDANSNHYPSNGDNIQLWGCNTHPEQLWHESGVHFNFANSSGMCLDANSNDYANDGDNIQLWGCNTHPEQEWTLTGAGQLQSFGTGMCLDANSNDYANDGDNVQLWACNTHPEQIWTLTSSGQLENSASGIGPSGPWPKTAGPVAANADYGYPYPDAPQCTAGPHTCVDDQWLFFQGQCTSWVAYRLNMLNGIAFNNGYRGQHWGSATTWSAAARKLNITVNTTPALGSVAWYASGHVAYVEQVNSPTSVVISEMNYDYANGFRLRTITTSSGWPTDFLHIADR